MIRVGTKKGRQTAWLQLAVSIFSYWLTLAGSYQLGLQQKQQHFGRTDGRATMTPQQQDANRLTPFMSGQKVQLIYKLFLLESSRNTLEQELVNFTNKAFEEVQGFFSSSCPSSVFSDLAKALDLKRQVVDKVSALLKELAVDSHINLKNGTRTKQQLQPFGRKANSDALKFGPLLQNSLIGSSIARAVQVFAASLPLHQPKQIPSPLRTLVQQDDTTCSVAPSVYSDDAAATSASQSETHMRAHAVLSEEKCRQDVVVLPPAIIHSPEIVQEKSAEQAPPTEIRNHESDRLTLLSWGCVEDVHVQHQKQTSSQLLHFLKAKTKNIGALEVTGMKQSKESMCTHCSPQSTPPTVKRTDYHFGRDVIDELTDAEALSSDVDNQTPVFKIKRVESGGSLIYTYVTATKTELWDIGDIFTEAEQEDSEVSPLENKACGNAEAEVVDVCEDNHRQAQTLRNAEAEPDGDPAPVKTPAVNSIPIPDFQFPKFEETEVVVSHIINPGNFYVQQADSAMKLQALVTDSWESSSSYAEQNCIPDIGTKVMGWFPKQEQWCRAQVTKICGVSKVNNAIKVEVKRLDYGDATCLSLRSIKELTPDMATLPLQAVQASLANVVPVNGNDWSDEAVGWFHTMVHNRILYARLYPKGPKVTVELFLEKGRLGAMRRGASVSLRLAQNGHAKHSKLRDVGLSKKNAVEVKRRQQDAEWEKYLISCYTQSKT